MSDTTRVDAPAKRRGIIEPIVVTETREYFLVTSTACPVCGFFVDLDVLGVLGVSSGGLTSESAAVTAALAHLWAANFKAFGLCGHQVTIDVSDAAAAVAQAAP